MIIIRQISNFWGRDGKKHKAPVVWPQSGVKDNFHGQVIQDDFSWLQDIKCHVSVCVFSLTMMFIGLFSYM